jgi:hypothetical protein
MIAAYSPSAVFAALVRLLTLHRLHPPNADLPHPMFPQINPIVINTMVRSLSVVCLRLSLTCPRHPPQITFAGVFIPFSQITAFWRYWCVLELDHSSRLSTLRSS